MPTPDPNPGSDASPRPPGTGDDANPRAFAQASGAVFQVVGPVLMLSSCCLFSLLGLIQEQVDQPIGSFQDWLTVATVPQIVGGLDVLFSTIAGAMLMAVGIGLQGERPSAGRHAVIVTTLLAVGWWASFLAFILFGGRWWQILLSLLLAAGATLLFLLAGTSARTLRLHPPPPDANRATPDLEPPTDSERVEAAIEEVGPDTEPGGMTNDDEGNRN